MIKNMIKKIDLKASYLVKSVFKILKYVVLLVFVIWFLSLILNYWTLLEESMTNTVNIEEKDIKFNIVNTVLIKEHSGNISIFTSGFVSDISKINIRATRAGTISFISDKLKDGSMIKKNDFIIGIDHESHKKRLFFREQAVISAYNALEKERMKDEISSKLLKKYFNYTRSGKSHELLNLEIKLQDRLYEKEKAEQDLNNVMFLAPYDCLIDCLKCKLGDYVTPGNSKDDFLVSLTSLKDFEIKGYLTSTQFKGIVLDNDDNLQVFLKCEDDSQKYLGYIKRVEGINEHNKMISLIFGIKGSIKNKMKILPNSFYTIEISRRPYERLFSVPFQAFSRTKDDKFMDTTYNKIYIIDKDNILREKKVEIIYIQGNSVVVKGDLNLNDQVAVSERGDYMDKLTDGTFVRTKLLS